MHVYAPPPGLPTTARTLTPSLCRAGRAKFAGAFSALSLGHRHIHFLGPEHGLLKVAAPGAKLVAENAR